MDAPSTTTATPELPTEAPNISDLETGEIDGRTPDSDTPETDAKAFDVLRVKGKDLHGMTKDGEYVAADFARDLERRLTAALAELERVKAENEVSNQLLRAGTADLANRINDIKELATLRADLERAREERDSARAQITQRSI